MRLTLVLMFISVFARAQTVDYEQHVIDYFFSDIFQSKYDHVNNIQFDGCTEDELSNFALFQNCLYLDSSIISTLDKRAYGKTYVRKKLDLSSIEVVTFKKNKTKSKLRMYVYQVNTALQNHYLIISIYKPKHFTHNYYFELDESGSILRQCDTQMIH